jgi:phage tail sheath protein FI
MPQYLSPGVYVEEIDAGPQPIEGVSTSICGAVGVTALGPTNGKPVLCTSFADFTRNFGGFLQAPSVHTLLNKWVDNPTDGGCWWLFPLAVKAFFDNGGQQLYVKRVFHQDLQDPTKSAQPATAIVGHGLVSQLNGDAAKGATQVKLAHLIGISDGRAVSIIKGDSQQPIAGGPYTVTDFNETTGIVTFDKQFPESLSVKRGDFVQLVALAETPADKTLSFAANSTGEWGNALSVRVDPMVGNTLTLLVDPTAGQTAAATATVTQVGPGGGAGTATVTVDNAAGLPGGDLADGDHVTIGGNEYILQHTDVANNKFDIVAAPAAIAVGSQVRRLRTANSAAAADTLNVWGASALYAGAIVEITSLQNAGTVKEWFTVVSVTGAAVKFSGNLANRYREGNRLRVIEAQVTVVYNPATGDGATEAFTSLCFAQDNPSYIVKIINDQSKLVTLPPTQQSIPTLANLANLANFPAAPVPNGVAFNNGDDKLESLTSDDFVGVDGGSGKRTGIQALEDITDISICIVPAMWSQVIQSALITHCETLKSRVAILDPPDGLGIDDIQSFRAPLETKYAALYYPWVVVRDPSISKDVNIAPSGHMAGIYARVDNDRGVWKAPANEVIQGITKIAQDVNKREQDLLNPKNINALRFFPDRGNLVWGARIVTSDTQWKYINVRRLFIYIEQSIELGTQWVVFEPNDQALWARVRQSISNFLETTWRQGALMGSKASEAFFVKCDLTTMTQDDLDNGRLICLIGIAPVKPAEFVIFRIQQKTLDQTTP